MKTTKRRILVMLLSVLVLCSSIPVFAADLPPNLSGQQIGRTIDAFVEEHRDTTAAVSVAVFNAESIIFENYYGHANIEEGVPNDASTVMDWGSVTKLITWVSVMQLVERGMLDLNSDIRTYLPEGFLTRLKYDDEITMLHLMNHSAGWQENYITLFLQNPSRINALEYSLNTLEPSQIYRPGEVTAYSNFGSALAGFIVERISGIPFSEYVHSNIFAPLGMENTAIRPDWSDNPRVRERRGELMTYSTNNIPLGTYDFYIQWYPAGSAVGTLSDFIKFAQALIPDERGGTVLFARPETLSQFHSPTSFYQDGTARIRHGMLSSSSLHGNVAGHGGNTAGCSAMLLVDFDRCYGAVVMTNQSNEGIYNYALMKKIFTTVEFDNWDNTQPIEPIRGVFRNKRTQEKGIQRILGIFSYYPIFQKNDGSINIPFIDMSITQVDSGVFSFRMGDISDLMHAVYDEDGKILAINHSTFDIQRVSAIEITIVILSLILLVAAVVYSFVYLIIALIRRIKKIKSPMNIWRMALCISIVIAFVNVIFTFVYLMSSLAMLTMLMINGILFILLGLVPIVYAIILSLKWNSLNLTKKQKVSLIVNGIMGLAMTFNLIYWQLWMFWVI